MTLSLCHPINQTLSQCKIAEKLLWRHKSHWAVQLQHRLLRLASPPATGLLQQTNQLYLSSAPGPCWLSVPPIFTLKWSYCVCVYVCVCIRVVRKDNKLTKTHPVPNPTTNLHYQDRGIHTLIDIQMWASDSHQNKPKRFALVPKSLSLAKIWITWTQGCCLSSGLVSGLWNLPTFVCSCLSSVGGGNHRDTHSQISELHHYLNSAALTPQSSFSLPSVLESTPTILATPKKLWELPLKKTYHLLFPMKKIRGKKLVNSLLCIKTCEGFLQRGSYPIQVPR